MLKQLCIISASVMMLMATTQSYAQVNNIKYIYKLNQAARGGCTYCSGQSNILKPDGTK